MNTVSRSCLAVLCILLLGPLAAQQLQGHFEDPSVAGGELRLLQARGGDMRPCDSIRISPEGDFRFPGSFRATGFYRLQLNDTDGVNIVLDDREPLVQLRFGALPMEENMQVEVSAENRRLLQLQHVVGEVSAIQASVAEQKAALRPTDTLQLEALDKIGRRALGTQAEFLGELAKDSADSYFARVYLLDRALGLTRGKGPMAVAEVFDFSDPELMRSTTYDGAVMAFLQNINVYKESQFIPASDTLLMLAGRHAETRAYMLEHLIDLFSTYGPEMALQHLIDRYVAPAGKEGELPQRLREKVQDLMAVSVGRTAPDVQMNDHGQELPLSRLVGRHRYTALFFYSSTCEHCHAQMPGLKQDYDKYRAQGFDVIGVALDVDSADFRSSIRENAIPWACYSEFNGWGSQAAKAFQVKGTPSFYLLDNAMKILAKPRDADELGDVLMGLYAGSKAPGKAAK